MSSYDLLTHNADPSEAEIRHALEGNLCRCTGYQNIVKAVQYAARNGGLNDVSGRASQEETGGTA